MSMYVGVNGIARKTKKLYIGTKKLENLFPDPLCKSTTTWNGGTLTAEHIGPELVGAKSLLLEATASVVEATAMTNLTIPLIKDHIYYASYYVYTNASGVAFNIYWPVAEPSFTAASSPTVKTVSDMKQYVWRVNRSSFDSGNYNFRIDFDNNNIAGKAWFSGFALVDLTAEFGSGSEPTLSWCANNIKMNPDGNLQVDLAGYSGVARRVKKVYVGVANKARLAYKLDGVSKVASPVGLSEAKNYARGGSVGSYALFAGGRPTASTNTATVDAYNATLTKTVATPLEEARESMASASIGDYVLFAGGIQRYGSSTGSKDTVDAYNTSLVHISPRGLLNADYYIAGTSIGDYALFGGGMNYCIMYYNTSLARNNLYDYSLRRGPSASSTTDYAFFAGGLNGNGVSAYAKNITKTSVTALSSNRYLGAGASVGDKVLFAGGATTDTSPASTTTNTVDVYNNSLVKGTTLQLSDSKFYLGGIGYKGYAIFAGGYSSSSGSTVYFSSVDVFDSNLVRTNPQGLDVARFIPGAASVGNYVLFGGGHASPTFFNTVDAYEVF